MLNNVVEIGKEFLYLQQTNLIIMNPVVLWVLSALCTIIGTLLIIGFNLLLKRIDKIAETLEVHNDKLISILTKHEVTSNWLDAHEKEIDDLKHKTTKLENRLATHKHK